MSLPVIKLVMVLGVSWMLVSGSWILDVEYSDHSSIQLFIEYQVSSIK